MFFQRAQEGSAVRVEGSAVRLGRVIAAEGVSASPSAGHLLQNHRVVPPLLHHRSLMAVPLRQPGSEAAVKATVVGFLVRGTARYGRAARYDKNRKP
jgi:hypothetical protein